MVIGGIFLMQSFAVHSQQPSPPQLTIEELEAFPFESEEERVAISELSVMQEFALDSQRKEIEDLVARKLGIISLKGDKSDLEVLQLLLEKGALRRDDVRGWQSLGIVFGDILVMEHGLTWISYQDDLAKSKALRWQKTDNYVFPVTFFSKRVQFKENFEMLDAYDEISKKIISFKN